MSSAISSTQVATWQAKLAALLLPDTVAVQSVATPTTYTGTVPTYTTDTDREAVPCRIDPPKLVERVTAGGLTVTQTEYPLWFAVETEPGRTKVLLTPDGTRFNIIEVVPEVAWTGLVRVQAARVGGAS